MGLSIELSQAHESHVFGSITVLYTWVNDERAMVLIPTHRKGAGWFIVCDSAAWRYDDERYLVQQARKACEVMGDEPSMNNAIKIAKIIHDGLETLIRMPSAPTKELIKGSFGRMQGRADGKVFAEEEIRLEKVGPTYG